MPRIIHFEIVADDPERAAAFYESAFGWKVEKWEGPMEYWLITTGLDEEPGINGGLARRSEDAPGTENTIGVDSVDDYVARVEEGGGTVLRPKYAIPGVGWAALCEDTEGNRFGLMQDDSEAA